MFSNKKVPLLISFLIVFIVVLCFSTGSKGSNKKIEVNLGGKSFVVDVADTNIKRSKGLSERSTLLDDQAMLFIFDTPGHYGFWMKDMKFQIDIIWFDENFMISHIEKSLQPETYPNIFYGSDKDLYVLEILAGQSEKLDLKAGDLVKFVKK